MTQAAALREFEAQALVVDRTDEPCEASEQLAIEQTLFDDLLPTSKRLRLWQPQAALIATVAEASRPGYARAVERSRERGFPVHVRRSGGGAVCLGPGALIVSYFRGSPRNDIDASYEHFALTLIEAAASLDASLTHEHVAGAYCDGRFDLAWNGRKVGGIAQRRRLWHGNALVWLHAVLAVEARSMRYPQQVCEFYADMELARVADPSSTSTLAHCLSGHADTHDLLLRLSDAIVQAFRTRASVGE